MEQQTLSFQKRRKLYMVMALTICICAGFGYAWSVLQNPIITVFQWPDSGVSLAYTLTVLCSTMAPLFFGSFLRKMSTRTCVIIGSFLFGGGLAASGLMAHIWQLYLFYGVLSGLGVGFIYPRMMSYVVQLFPEKPGVASGLGTAFYGAGAIIWAPIATTIIQHIGLLTAFRILGIGFLLIICVCAVFLRDIPEGYSISHSSTPSTDHDELALNRAQMVKTGHFYLMIAIFVCGLVAGMLIISQASPILQQTLQYTAARAAVFVSVFSACNMIGRFLWGSISDKIGLTAAIKAIFACCIASMAILFAFQQNTAVLIAMGAAAACYGGLASILTPLTARVFGSKYITENYGVMYLVFGLASLIGPGLATSCKTITGSYSGAYFGAGILALAGLLLSFILTNTLKKRSILSGGQMK